MPEQIGYTGQFVRNYHSSSNKRNTEQLQERSKSVQNQQQPPVDVRNRFTAPMGLAAIGYRFFASSPIHNVGKSSPTMDPLKNTPISPIGSGNYDGSKSSISTGRSTPTAAEGLALTTGRSTPISTSSGRSTPVQSSSGRSTPTNLLLSPTKSTMSNEELFAAIHKSKRRLNIKDDGENLSPCGSTNSLVQNQPGSRHSWSPESQKIPEVPQSAQSPSSTSRLDFKRLLLQQSVKTGPVKLSAAEQLKLSRQQCQQQQQSLQNTQQYQTPPIKVLSPRSAWRFQTPRTDVLSSTIIEDAAAEEKAMKPSPENPSPISRLNSRRQLDLCSDLPEHLNNQNYEEEIRTYDGLSSESFTDVGIRMRPYLRTDGETLGRINFSVRQGLENNELSNEGTTRTSKRNVLTGQRAPVPHVQNIVGHTMKEASQNAPQSSAQIIQTPRSHAPPNTFETRRLNNQLARAQFLANIPNNHTQNQNTYYQQHRARSESPQHVIAHNVSRSPSAPTLETAL